MTKYSFVIFHKETDAFLKGLMELGVVDITRGKNAVDAISLEQFELLARYNKTIKLLNSTRASALANKIEVPSNKIESNNLLEEIEATYTKVDEIDNSLKGLNAEYNYAKPWGEFSVDSITKIKELNLVPHFYIVNAKSFNIELEKSYPIETLNNIDGKLYIVVLSNKEEEYNFPYPESQLPQRSYKEVEAEITTLKETLKECKNNLLKYSNSINELEMLKDDVANNLDLYLAGAAATKRAEETIEIFEGFAPTENAESVATFLQENNVYYLQEEAKESDNPPIKLKNNFFAKLYEPIGELYMLPTYGETDLTIFFAPFYMLFFGFCLGDMGYGLVLILLGLFVNFKIPKFAKYGKLVSWLGVGACLIPILNGTFFGAKLYELVPALDSYRELFLSDMEMFWFAILFGLFQIIFARVLNAILSLKKGLICAGISNLGWAICITWASLWYASSEVPFSYPDYIDYIGMGGLALIILFTSNSKNPLIRLFKGVSALYDSTSVFGDMLSYIRLFGLGTAGGILGLVVNSVAMQMSGIPAVGWVLAIIMLLVGHVAVLLLSCLGAFVHPMRLTFVEFYKNAGFQGGGRGYSPLAKKEKTN